MLKPLSLLLTLTHLTSLASCWGFLGHRSVALLATRYMHPDTAKFVRSLIYKDETIMSAACWADRFSHVPLGRFSAPWHYIDAMDEPPHWCGVMYSRDCQGAQGCIVSAIVNMTARVVDTDLPWYQRSQAVKFLLHFLGDIHQPLHTENLSRGGNSIPVKFKGGDTNLHSAWDSKFLNAFHKGDSEAHAVGLVNMLEERIDDGIYKEKKAAWRGCLDPTNAEDCAISWATDANKIVCSYVLKDGEEGIKHKELSGEYADGAVEIIHEQIAMGGYRLAGYLNMIVTNSTGLEDKYVTSKETLTDPHVRGTSPYCSPEGYWDGEQDEYEWVRHIVPQWVLRPVLRMKQKAYRRFYGCEATGGQDEL